MSHVHLYFAFTILCLVLGIQNRRLGKDLKTRSWFLWKFALPCYYHLGPGLYTPRVRFPDPLDNDDRDDDVDNDELGPNIML